MADNKERIEWVIPAKRPVTIDGLKISTTEIEFGYIGDLMLFQIYKPLNGPKVVLKILFPYFHQKQVFDNNFDEARNEAEKVLVKFLKTILGDEYGNPEGNFIL